MDYRAEILIRGHILNPFWKTRLERRRIRGEVTRDAVCRRLEPYLEFMRGLAPENAGVSKEAEGGEKIFSIWLQGEENAPEVVKACWRSVRKNCPQELVVLDGKSIGDWIELPEHIAGKWRDGKMKPAHFTDVCRLALLERHGGLWLDATDYVPAAFPQWLWDCGFFMHTAGTRLPGWYASVQNCFIRSERGNFLTSAWLRLVCEYWRREDRAADYFVHQLLFSMLVENNAEAARRYGEMPKIVQDPTHALWFGHGNSPYDPETWDELASAALFQKTEYKSEMATSPKPGSNAWHLIHGV